MDERLPFKSGATRLDHSPHGAPTRQRQPPPLPDAHQVTEERDWDRQMARYRRSRGTPATRRTTQRIIGERD